MRLEKLRELEFGYVVFGFVEGGGDGDRELDAAERDHLGHDLCVGGNAHGDYGAAAIFNFAEKDAIGERFVVARANEDAGELDVGGISGDIVGGEVDGGAGAAGLLEAGDG